MRLLNWLRRGALEHDLERELQYHLQRRVADLTQSGLSESDARARAAREIGGLAQVREEVRDVWLTRWLRDFAYDLRFSARSVLHTPSFTATAVLSLALGIGATTAICSLVDQVILHELPVRDPGRLVLIDWKGIQLADTFGSWNLMSYPLCRDLQQHEEVFDGVFCRALTTVTLSMGEEHTPVSAELVSGTYFSVLGVGPALGRVVQADDDQTPDARAVVVLAYDYWKTQLASAPDVVGRKILINQHPMTIVGVAAAGFRGIDVGEVPSLWIPASMAGQAIPSFTDLLNRRTRWVQILGRLRPDVTLAQAQAALQPWFKAMLEEDTRRAGFPTVTAERRQRFLASTLELTPAPQGHSSLRRQLSKPLWVLFAATAVLLGLACLNVAGLFVARGSAREREISTRLALGASPGRIGRQLLADSVLLSLAGGLLGLALAPMVMRTLIAFLPHDTAANALASTIDARLLAFAFVISVAAGLISGLAPALHAGRKPLVSSLRERGGSGGGARLRKIIVAVEIALSLMLVIGAVLFARTLTSLLAKGPGFDTASRVSFGINPLQNGYSPEQAGHLLRRIYDAIDASPWTASSAMVNFPFLNGGAWATPMTIQADQRIVTDGDVNLNAVSPGFFATLGIKMVAGRNFDERDSGPVGVTNYRSAIVNEAFVKRYLGGRDPIGALVRMGTNPTAPPNIPIVGVVADFSYRGLRDASEQAYFSIFESGGAAATFYVRVRGTAEQAAQAIRSIVHDADPAVPIKSFRTVDEQISRSLITERMLATLSASFGALALVLSLIGLYGVMSFVVTQRTREIGIRMALGARARSAVWLVLRDALEMIVAGTAIALPCVVMLGRLVESQLFGVTATDPVTMTATPLALAAVALGASLVPAYVASTVNPTDALRAE
ncbi:MAG TPA: ABC transporter permease [Vicinamibacterales bacterium]|nr:ABC transporter permease [Vicinamibacterales bacterium]